MYDQLMQLPVFQGVTLDQMTRILETTPFDFQTYRSGEVFSRSGDRCEGAVFLISGRVKLETPVFNHRVTITQMFDAPYTFSLHHLFGAEPSVHSTMTAVSDKAGIMLLKKQDFLRILRDNEVTLINTLNMLCTKAQKQHKAIDFSAETDPVLKLSSWMLAFTERTAKEVVIEALESDWCGMLQLDRPAFWRCVASLEGQHILESENGRLKLLDRYGLKSLVSSKTAQKD